MTLFLQDSTPRHFLMETVCQLHLSPKAFPLKPFPKAFLKGLPKEFFLKATLPHQLLAGALQGCL
jgi:hypothetical protein